MLEDLEALRDDSADVDLDSIEGPFERIYHAVHDAEIAGITHDTRLVATCSGVGDVEMRNTVGDIGFYLQPRVERLIEAARYCRDRLHPDIDIECRDVPSMSELLPETG